MVMRAVVGLALVSLMGGGCAHGTPVRAPVVVFVERVNGETAIPTSGASSDQGGGDWKAKEEVEVEWHGSWWPAVVVEKRGGSRWLVHYEGYGDDWDEVVGSDRIRERRAELQLEVGDEKDDEPDP
jgi:hypothetical protein